MNAKLTGIGTQFFWCGGWWFIRLAPGSEDGHGQQREAQLFDDFSGPLPEASHGV
jgi:hypothetical protein